ncbi:MAG: HAD family hydrolase [Gemmatimonadetes bacterium]|nr:HAD family hydrolase [Gemmatimonadota bacterium]
MTSPLVVFDIDGTLTDTMDVDVECFERAVLEVVGVEIPATWSSFGEVTDPAIVETACRLAGRPTPDEVTLHRAADRTGELLEAALTTSPSRFSPVPGAPTIFDRLRAAGCRVAMATGAWRPSAEVKLRGSGLADASVPLATSSEHPARADIIREAVARAGGDGAETTVYVGDGVWDGRAALELGYRFVGVGAGDRARRLRDVGAHVVVPDLKHAVKLMA